ncbi:MAG: RNA polymerase sigma factor (sigma-70 family) [Arenicella sp.]|jgi:RNA polymerase sigma factor (sigma-70 family)
MNAVAELTNKTDAQLIALFIEDGLENAFDVLLRRYYNVLHKRFSMHVKDSDVASDLCQQLWMRVISNLVSYQDNDKFEHYLNTIASNLMKDHWRRNASHREGLYETEEEAIEIAFDNVSFTNSEDVEHLLSNREMITKLVHELIPALPCEQRLIYLLKHEAEHWDKDQPLQWQHLADLISLSVDEVCAKFESARDKLMRNTMRADCTEELECIETSVFLLWTLSQRRDKTKKYTETYFAELLNIPVNTFKTRYRASIKVLSEGMR